MSSEGSPPPHDPQDPGQQPGQPQAGQPQAGQPPGEPQAGGYDQGPVVYPPPGTQSGAGWGTQGPGYAPPPQDPYAHLRRDHPKATTAMVLGIVGVVLCGFAAPFAWSIGGKALKEIDASQGILGGRGQAQAGKILGIIGTVLLVLGVLAFVLIMLLAIAGASTSASTG